MLIQTRAVRVYSDTTVFGGIADPEFATASHLFFQRVATDIVNHCAIIVIWNFRDIVNFRKIPLYNAVNGMQGYANIAIYSPLELTKDDDEIV